MNKIALYIGVVASTALICSPAFASGVPKVPEPSTLSLVGGVAIALIIANRFIRRK